MGLWFRVEKEEFMAKGGEWVDESYEKTSYGDDENDWQTETIVVDRRVVTMPGLGFKLQDWSCNPDYISMSWSDRDGAVAAWLREHDVACSHG